MNLFEDLTRRLAPRVQLTAALGVLGMGRGALPASPPRGRYPLPDGPDVARLLARRGGQAPGGLTALDGFLAGLDDEALRQVVDPLGRASAVRDEPVTPLLLGGKRMTQVDETTCGSAVLALLVAAGDPVIGSWLVTGRLIAAARVPSAWLGAFREHAGGGPVDRFQAFQRVVKVSTGTNGIGPVPWPARFGTPPWRVAAVARYADVRYTHRIVDDASSAGRVTIVAAVEAASRGVPVPLFSGGDLGTGPDTALPRHVVLLTEADPLGVDVGRADGGTARGSRATTRAVGERFCSVYEPSSGTTHRLSVRALLDGSAARTAALGGWRHVCWAVLPVGTGGAPPLA